MIKQVARTYSVCRDTGTCTYRHTVELNGAQLCAEHRQTPSELHYGRLPAAAIDAYLQGQIMDTIRRAIYKDAA